MDILDTIMKFLPILGPGGIVLLLWYVGERTSRAALQAYREDTLRQSQEHEKALAAAVQMYKDNVQLVKSYEKIAEGLQDLIVLNTQTITRLCDKVDGNQFCPMVRTKK